MSEQAALPPCPKDVADRGDILNANGFGFQSPGGVQDYFVIARVGEDDIPDHQMNLIKQETGSKTVANNNWLGRAFLQVHWTEYNLIDRILNMLLQLDIAFFDSQ